MLSLKTEIQGLPTDRFQNCCFVIY